MSPILQVTGLCARHGLLEAVRDVDLTVTEGETVALVGANGAGKTTLLRTLAGAHPAASGTVEFAGEDVTATPAHRRVHRGVALVPEGRRLFADMTVEENLQVAGRRARKGPWTIETVLEAFPMLVPLRRQAAGTLSGGQQQAASIGRALMTNPRLLLVDEVSLGLSPVAVDAVYESLATLTGQGATLVLVEQDLSRATRVASRVLCMLEGRIVLEGPARELTRDQITAAYFGVEARSPAPQPKEPV